MSARNVASSCSPASSISLSRSSCDARRLADLVDDRELGGALAGLSTSRAFSRATLRLDASVVSSRTSDSLNAFVRSRFWSEMRPKTSLARDQRREDDRLRAARPNDGQRCPGRAQLAPRRR